MKNKFIAIVSSLVFVFFSATSAKSKSITLGWAAWDPANALVELSKGFTAETGIDVNFEFVPWPNFADRMLNELNNQGKKLIFKLKNKRQTDRKSINLIKNKDISAIIN